MILLWGSKIGSEDDDLGDALAPEEVSDEAEPAFTAFAGTSRQLPRGVKKRLTRIASTLKDVFQVGVQSALQKCKARWSEAPEDKVPDLVESSGADDTFVSTQFIRKVKQRPRREFKVLEIFSWAMVLLLWRSDGQVGPLGRCVPSRRVSI